MKEKNPYERILRVMQKVGANSNNEPLNIGKILASPPNIRVQYKGIILEKDEIWISSYLLPGYTRHMVGETNYRGGGGGYAVYESHNHPIDNDEIWTDTLVPGDYVSITPLPAEDGKPQQYIIHDKIEHL